MPVASIVAIVLVALFFGCAVCLYVSGIQPISTDEGMDMPDE